MAVPLLAIEVLHANPFEISVLVALETVPWLAFGLPVGVWVERWDKRRVLVATGVVRTMAFAAVPALWLADLLTFWSLFGVILVAATATVFAQTVSMAVVPLLVKRDRLVEANSRLSAVDTSASIAGEGLGGVIVAAIGGALAFGVDAATSLISTVLLGRLRLRTQPCDVAGRSFLRELRDGIRLTFGDKAFRSLTVSSCLQNFLVAARYALVPIFLVSTLGASAWLVGILLACEGVGGLIGAVLAERFAARWGSGVVWRWALGLCAVVSLGIPLATSDAGLVVFALSALAFSACATIISVMTSTARQALCPPEMLSRLSATSRTLTWGVIPLGALTGGAIAAQLGFRDAIWIMAAAFVLPWLSVALGPLRNVKRLESEHADQAATVGPLPGAATAEP